MSKATNKQTTRKKATRPKPRPTKTAPALTGYARFTREVFQLLRTHRAVFGRLVLVATLVLLLITGTTQQSEYSDLAASTEMFSSEVATGIGRTLLEIGVIFVTVISGALTSVLSESQQIYAGAAFLFLWLSVVWLLRHQLAGTEVQLRDALYSAGAPLISTLAIVTIAIIQLLPLALAATVLSSAIASGVLSGAAGLVLSLGVVLVVGGLTLFWLTTTFFAAIVVTIPGTYPLAAFRSAKQLIAGHRVSVLLRVIWLALVSVIVFVLTVLPVIALDRFLNASGSPLVPIVLQLVTSALTIYGAAYVYLLYRRIIDERS